MNGCFLNPTPSLYLLLQDPTEEQKEASGPTAILTRALGKCTKYQQSHIAQLVLVASSPSPVVDATETGDAGGLQPVPLGGSGEQSASGTGVSVALANSSRSGSKRGDEPAAAGSGRSWG